MNHYLAISSALCAALSFSFAAHAQDSKLDFRPPSVPLVTHDPYLSIWSSADKLTDDVTRHWTHAEMRLTGLIRIDGETFRVLGNMPEQIAALPQVSTQVLPTRTICTFQNAKIKLVLTFVTPAIPSDIALLSTPITFVTWDVSSVDGQSHDVSALFTAGADMARHEREQAVKASDASKTAKTPIVKLGTVAQPVLERSGDATRIDWGYACLGGRGEGVAVGIGAQRNFVRTFAENGTLAAVENENPNTSPALGATIAFGKVEGSTPVSRHLLIGYDDDKSVEWMGQWLSGYWKKDGATIEDAFEQFEANAADIIRRCETFDKELVASLTERGGDKYAQLVALAHRHSLAATKVVADLNGAPLMFSKENNSNGCMGTVDVFFPQIPQLLLLNNDLAKATATPILKYASSPRWKWPYAPHDVGVYPKGNGQVYGGGERTEDGQMPVEESGNMLLILGGISKADGNAEFAKAYWPILTKWAKYLEEHGVDPANQLCTDDFAGHLARNANLSVKAILGIASYAMMADMLGHKEEAEHYMTFAKSAAQQWMKMADAGDHYSLAFEKPETWSQKYNLVWQYVLDVDVFPREVIDKELAFYKTKMQPYGLPLDSRKLYTKADWEMWTATLADDRATFDQYVDGLYKYANESERRTPFADWYWTDSSRVEGFTARPVIGGLFMPMLKDEKVWKAWASKAKPLQNVTWAELPVPPKTVTLVPTSESEPQQWRYSFEKPADGWQKTDFADSSWKQGEAGFGTRGTPGGTIRTVWNTDDIWIRRSFTMPANDQPGDLALFAHHDEDVEIYLDGELLATAKGHTGQYGIIKLKPEQQAKLTAGTHTFAVHCRQTGGGQYIDVGVVRIEPQPKTAK